MQERGITEGGSSRLNWSLLQIYFWHEMKTFECVHVKMHLPCGMDSAPFEYGAATRWIQNSDQGEGQTLLGGSHRETYARTKIASASATSGRTGHALVLAKTGLCLRVSTLRSVLVCLS